MGALFESVLVANRGEIALRILRTLRRLGIRSIAVYSEADRAARHVFEADEAVNIGPAPAAQSYLNREALLAACRHSRAQAVHPGYGFLSENADFAAALEAAGIAFVGPTPAQMRSFGLKHTARELAQAAGLPLLPGSGLLPSLDDARREAARIGYPVMLKSSAGGGGIGMQLCRSDAELAAAYVSVLRVSANNFGDPSLFLERFVERARHIEVQLFGDGRGEVVALGERDCSAQRRNQKVIEESPAPDLAEPVRRALLEAALRLGQSVGYRSAGTVEFIYDVDRREFYFLEVNTRLQVEHPVTEMVTGIDLVEWMIQTAAGQPPDLGRYRSAVPNGHAIEVRIYAEDPARGFQPSAGLLTEVVFPPGVRVDGSVEAGSEVSPFYDPMLAKLIVHGRDRAEAVGALQRALAACKLGGIETNLEYLRKLTAAEAFTSGALTTAHLPAFQFSSDTFEVVAPGTFSLVVDHPGRIGYWDVGIPPSGPFDGRSFRLANRVVGNPPDAAGLECTVVGPSLRFARDALVALVGARMAAQLDGTPVPYGEPVTVQAGQTLELGAILGPGCRTYLAVRGGLDVPMHLGSRTTFTLGGIGGHGGRALRRGDVLHVGGALPLASPRTLPHEAHPQLTPDWVIEVAYGPHGAPDFFTERDIETLFSTRYEVHHHSARTGVRLIGPKPEWARRDGGEAGLHPSNIHDNAYAIGSVDFTGDMPILLGQDGPSLGGFVCPATVVSAELWKLGQLAPGNGVRFRPVPRLRAEQLESAERSLIEHFAVSRAETPGSSLNAALIEPAVQRVLAAPPAEIEVRYRRAGDAYLLVEYGPLVLDLRLRFRVHSLMGWIEQSGLRGLIDVTPGIRSLQLHYDRSIISEAQLLDALAAAERELPPTHDVQVPSRIVHLPLSWDDPATRLAIVRYMQLVRKDAPWCPSNIEFIRRINGLDSIADVQRTVFEASYLVLGLGDVYLGAPVATPLDPRHRLVTTKYNPARTWTPENAVGIGGAYMCIYGMEGPGGYQFVGRTLQVFNRFKQTPHFEAGKPWLLRFFDQIRFYPVSAEELLELREAFPHGKLELSIEESRFGLAEYEAFLATHAQSIEAFRGRQRAAFEAERRSWQQNEGSGAVADVVERAPDVALPPGHHGVDSPVPGSVWKIHVQPGAVVRSGEPLIIVESMKMEIPIEAPMAGRVVSVAIAEGGQVSAGQCVVVLVRED